MSEDGTPTLREARAFNRIDLKDEDGRFFPVCPFFELHGAWTQDGEEAEGPITRAVIEDAGLSLADVRWTVAVANLKAYHYTLQDGDRVEATVEVTAADTRSRDLQGLSPPVAGERLVLGPSGVRFGKVQTVRPTDALPGLRLRVSAPEGVVYAPMDVGQRIAADPNWSGFDIPVERRIVNPNGSWAKHRIPADAPGPLAGDLRVNPRGLAATFRPSPGVAQALGLLDDVSDGIVTCQVAALPAAHARIAIGPPDFSPGSRPFVSLQDGLSDRVGRDAARADDVGFDELQEIVADIFERALETSDLMNKDAQTERAHGTNEGMGQALPPPSSDFEQPPIFTLWPRSGAATSIPGRVDALPVSFLGQRKHRRLNALEYVKDRLRDDPAFVARWVRSPLDDSAFYDRRMPALMRGSDSRPMHLTRRQYELVRRWAEAFTAGETG